MEKHKVGAGAGAWGRSLSRPKGAQYQIQMLYNYYNIIMRDSGYEYSFESIGWGFKS